MKRKYLKNVFIAIFVLIVVIFSMYCLSSILTTGTITFIGSATDDLEIKTETEDRPSDSDSDNGSTNTLTGSDGDQTVMEDNEKSDSGSDTNPSVESWGIALGTQFDLSPGATDYDVSEIGVPQIPYANEDTFCIDPGTDWEWDITGYDGYMTYEYAQEWKDWWGNEGLTELWKHTYDAGGSIPLVNYIAGPVYTVVSQGTLSPAAAYIASMNIGTDGGETSWYEKQKAFWNLYYSGLDEGLILSSSAGNEYAGSSEYDEGAAAYAEYYEKTEDNLLDIEDQTVEDDIIVKVDQTTEEYTIGPFNISYISGIVGDYAFSGISDMYCIGYDAEGNVVVDRIEIKEILLANSSGVYEAVEPQYIELLYSNDYVDDPDFQDYCPESNQDFQIVIDNPNVDGVSTVAYVKLRVYFKMMRCRSSIYCFRR